MIRIRHTACRSGHKMFTEAAAVRDLQYQCLQHFLVQVLSTRKNLFQCEVSMFLYGLLRVLQVDKHLHKLLLLELFLPHFEWLNHSRSAEYRHIWNTRSLLLWYFVMICCDNYFQPWISIKILSECLSVFIHNRSAPCWLTAQCRV